MSRLQSVENQLISINETVFQELCDSFLLIRNDNYKTFSRVGSMAGKQKTIQGTPDSFFLLPNGKYIFIEYSTNISKGLSKLKEDVVKCIDSKKTGVSTKDIAEIIICINFNLNANEIQELRSIISKTRIVLTVYMLDNLAIELHLHHRNLVHEYLGLPLDTGQVVSIDQFIEQYDKASKGISTPLNNPFLHRESELKDIKELLVNNDLIILYGSAGVGKTKLAIEVIQEYIKEYLSFDAYCVSYKNAPLLDDLYQYIRSDKDYFLFVDDANRIDAFSQIIGFYKNQRSGNLKIIITVRDYAFYVVNMLCQEFRPAQYSINKLTDEQIIDIIKQEPFGIINSRYHKEITRIADGNPRLAIMTALLAQKEQNIHALSDVSDLFEQYFSTFVKDEGEFANSLNIKILGVVAFFYTIPYKDKGITEPILKSFDIDYISFIECIEKLDRLELVEIQYDYIKISEQNLSTYFFYKAFIKDSLLSFETLLLNYFDSNTNRFTDCVIPANNTFGYQNVMEKLQPILQNYWMSIKTNDERALKLLSIFWFYLQDEALELVYNTIESLPENDCTEYEVKYETNEFVYKNTEIIELLGHFFVLHNRLKDALELSFEYVRKLPTYLPELIHKIRENLIFDWEDQDYGFVRQRILFDTLINGLDNSDALYSRVFYELSKTFLSFKFQQTKAARNHAISIYQYPIPNDLVVQSFRKKIWDAVYRNFESNKSNSFELLESYANVSPDVIKEIMEYDISFVIPTINTYLSVDSFEHCRYVQNQIRWCKRNKISNPAFTSLSKSFKNKLYETYLKIDWDRFRDKESYDFDNHREYEKLKEEEIRTSFRFVDNSEAKSFYKDFVYLRKLAKNDWSYNQTLDIVIDENCAHKFEVGCFLLLEIIESNNGIDYIPARSFQNHLNEDNKIQTIWKLIQASEFNLKTFWELSFYENMQELFIKESHIESLKHTIKTHKSNGTLYIKRLEKYLQINSNLFKEILEIIVERNEKEIGSVLVWMSFFEDHFNQLGDDMKLIEKSYLQQLVRQNHFDYQKKGLLRILSFDKLFLVDYVNELYKNKKDFGSLDDDQELNIVWQVDGVEHELQTIFDLANEKEPYYGIGEHFCNSFFWNLPLEHKQRAKSFLINYVKENYLYPDKINIVVDIARHAFKESFNDLLLEYLTLTQDKDLFSKIYWRGNGSGVVSGDVNFGDLEAADWKNIQSIVEQSTVGFKLLPIKRYIINEIDNALRYADWERKNRFVSRM